MTNSGPSVQLGAVDVDQIRFALDWGAMMNVSSMNAVGASWFVFGQSGDNITAGPALRWRRWFGPTRSLDVAFGTNVFSRASESFDTGSLLGLVKYNPVRWFGVAVRPELVRYTVYDCTEAGCPPPARESAGRLYLGAEIGELSGVGLGVAAGITVLAILVSMVTGDDCCN